MKKLKTFGKKIMHKISVAYGGNSCPKCGGWIDYDDDCCQICGYPWSD